MKEVFIKRSEQKYIVMEGLTTAEKLDSVSRPIVPIFSCLYAGLIGAEFGLVNLIEAFRLLPKDRFSLSLYGPWMLQSQYPNLAALPSNVHFMGETENSKILSAERAVNLLINPRPSSAYYTRFSFPSKTIEYLSSGTPVLTTKLPGIPPEYNPYLFFVDDETPQGLANAISKVADKGSGFLQVFGERGAEFVRTEKNSTVQARRIVDAFKI
jgi:glycosyltransferase involved in cell wall biosynthesis